jgi:hypothetical protein
MDKILNRRPRFLLFLLLLLPVFVLGRDAREQQRIDYLIGYLASLKGAVFIRNGTEYDAKAARDHLQSKLDYAGERVKTAEQFIQYCAAQSSMSHKPYQIRFADGTVTDTASFFTAKLKEFDQRKR